MPSAEALNLKNFKKNKHAADSSTPNRLIHKYLKDVEARINGRG